MDSLLRITHAFNNKSSERKKEKSKELSMKIEAFSITDETLIGI